MAYLINSGIIIFSFYFFTFFFSFFLIEPVFIGGKYLT